jgi:hypothetical protein
MAKTRPRRSLAALGKPTSCYLLSPRLGGPADEKGIFLYHLGRWYSWDWRD